LFAVSAYVLPQKLRAQLNHPLGELVSGRSVDLGQLLRARIKSTQPAKVILVGDSVSRSAYQAGLKPDLIIIDKLEKRQPAVAFTYPSGRVIKARNRAGMIEDNARLAVERAIRGEADLIEVDGEEDLLAIVTVLAAPAGSIVVYGQPHKGVVIVRVTETAKANAAKILEQMDRVEQS